MTKIGRVYVRSLEIDYEDLEPELRELIEKGEVRCAICKRTITKEDIGIVYSEDGTTWIICRSCPGTLRTTFLSERGPRFTGVELAEEDAVKL